MSDSRNRSGKTSRQTLWSRDASPVAPSIVIDSAPSLRYDVARQFYQGAMMKLGAFSISLAVKDLEASRQFYEALGFKVFAGAAERNYLILKNESHTIGLFQGMFDNNILTFNPGWDSNGEPVGEFEDVRDIQRKLKESGLTLTSEADEDSQGPASIMLTDPDGNTILLDQHV